MYPSEFNKDKQKVLIVDDEIEFLRYAKLILKTEGFIVKTLSDPIEALNILQKDASSFDLLITDMVMKDMSGLLLIQKLKESNIKIPTFVVSAFCDRETIISLLRCGCREYLEKPITKKEFIERIQSILMDVSKEQKSDEKSISRKAAVSFLKDMRNYLDISFSYAERALIHGSHEIDMRNYLRTILKSVVKGEKVARWPLLLNHYYYGAINKKTVINIGNSIDNIVKQYQFLVERSIEIRCELSSDLSTIYFDSLRFDQLIENILNYFIQSMEAGVLHIISESTNEKEASLKLAFKNEPYDLLTVKEKKVDDQVILHKKEDGVDLIQSIVKELGGTYFFDHESNEGLALYLQIPVSSPVSSP